MAPPLPSALDAFEEISRRAQGKRVAIFLDYDGTLTPIVETPDQALMTDAMREMLTELSRLFPVGVISGRDLSDLREKVGIESILYAGSHGFDISGPKGWKVEHQVGTGFLPLLDRAQARLIRDLGSIEGLQVERKKFAIAVHYRLVDPENLQRIEKIVNEVAAGHPELRKACGKKIFELQPNMDWHKGKALLHFLEALDLNRSDLLPIYLGDDVTDEDAFRVLRGWGVGIVVGEEPYETAAAYRLKNSDETLLFLRRLIAFQRKKN
jgi:trehalose 6-phosphate phosphatase